MGQLLSAMASKAEPKDCKCMSVVLFIIESSRAVMHFNHESLMNLQTRVMLLAVEIATRSSYDIRHCAKPTYVFCIR